MSESNTLTGVSARALVSSDCEPIAWEQGAAMIMEAKHYWLATVLPDGRPHAMPVLAVGVDGFMYFCSNASTRKARNLRRNMHCALTASTGGYDLVIHGSAAQITNDTELRRIAEAYDDRYGWRVNVREGAFQDTEGAPTAGPPPYGVYSIIPETAYAFGTRGDSTNLSTRWDFSS